MHKFTIGGIYKPKNGKDITASVNNVSNNGWSAEIVFRSSSGEIIDTINDVNASVFHSHWTLIE